MMTGLDLAGRRVAAFGIESAGFPEWLESSGADEYEIYFDGERTLRAAGGAPSAGKRAVYSDPAQMRFASGDVLFVEGRAVFCLAKYSLFKKYEKICARPATAAQAAALLFHFLRYFVSGRRLLLRFGAIPADGRGWILFTVRRVAAKRSRSLGRMHLPRGMEYEDLFARLNNCGAEYVVLRWWERLPDIPANQDVDILIADKDRDRVFALLSGGAPGPRALDVYTESGVEHSGAEITYYEPEHARAILRSARDGPGGCKIPAPREAFMALAYHALYHKGFHSGLSSVHREHEGGGRFFRALSQGAEALHIPAKMDMESLDDYLAAQGWRPPMDKLARLAAANEWARARFFGGARPRGGRYVGAFVLRRECEEFGATEFALRRIEEAGFKIKEVRPIPEDRVAAFAEKMRGGNWRDGTPPMTLAVVEDMSPQWNAEGEILDNLKMRRKEDIRAALNRRHKTHGKPWLHGCDNARESEEYIREIAPDLAESIFAK